ncbi:MAG: hypothetical protein ACQEQL_06350 [Pseudomonadota bacterium]
MTDTNISDLEIQALVDNELEWEQAKHVLNCIDEHPWARRRYDELVRQKNLLRDWWNSRSDS